MPNNTTARKATYHLCPRCLRAVPAQSGEHYCINDGERLLERCPNCGKAITSPFARHCANCGHAYRAQVQGRGKTSPASVTLEAVPQPDAPRDHPN